MEKGRFITLEGIEGVGKSTNIAFIAKLLQEQGKRVITTREPGGTPIAESIRQLLLTPMSRQAEFLLLFAARAEHVTHVIQPALARGEWVICDRFTDSTYVYQGTGRGVPMELINRLESFVQGSLSPDLTILLDLDPKTALERAKARGKTDRYEAEGVVFFKKLREAYLALAKQHPERFRVIDANQSLEKIQAQIKQVILSVPGCQPSLA